MGGFARVIKLFGIISDGIRFVLHSRVEAMPFYAKLGFAEAPDVMWRDRKRRP